MKYLIAMMATVGSMLFGSLSYAEVIRPTVILVHGAFADASSWNGVVKILKSDGYPVIAAANPLRSVRQDAAYIASLVGSIKSPVVLVGHSYGGMVINDAASQRPNVKALVFVAGFAPDKGETALALSGRFPGSTLGTTLAPAIPLAAGGNDLYIQQDRFPAQFAADLPASEALLMAVTQRPVAQLALEEAAVAAAWKTIPSWFVYGDADKNIPPAAQANMASRAGSRQTVVIRGGSHVVMISHPDAVAKLIERAARN